mgnify:FL=1
MNAQDLKNSILQLAVQGKLVEQRAEEGTARELLEQIKLEKDQLIKDKKIKKSKPLPEITEEEIPFEIPEPWEWVRVGEVGSWSAGATPSRQHPEYYEGNIPWLKTGDLNDGYIVDIPEFVGEIALEKTSLRLNPVGSVLMAMYGATIGKLGILEIEATTNQACCACIPYSCVMNKYLFYYLMSQRRNYIKMGAGGAQPNISKEKIVISLIPLPPLEEQHRIVAKIEEILPYIDQYDKAYTKLETFNKKFPEDMKKSILQMAMQGKLVDQRLEEGTAGELYDQIVAEKAQLIKDGKIKKEKPLPEITEDEIPFEIPSSWRWVRLGEITILQNGDRSSKYPVESDYVENGIPFFGAKDMGEKYLSYDNVRYISQEKFNALGNGKLKDEDFVCLLRGSVGKVAIFKSDETHDTGFICAQMVILSSICKDSVEYLYSVLKSPYYFEIIKLKTTGTAVKQLPAKELGNVIMPLPPLEEQKRIVAKIEELLPYCNQLIKS